MAGIIGKLTGLDTIREDMKKRVDEIIKVGESWNKTANQLIKSLNELKETIQESHTDLRPINKNLSKLATQTKRLSKAFEAHRRTLNRILGKLDQI